VYGAPGHIGGADTELWHTLLVWLAHGVRPEIIVHRPPADTWQSRLAEHQIPVHVCGHFCDLVDVAGLAGSIVVAFCNPTFCDAAPFLRALGCRLVWVNCMTWPFPGELSLSDLGGPFDAYVFQSRFQRAILYRCLARYGVRREQCFLIRGAFDVTQFPFRPRSRAADDDFVMGRLARPDLDKWHPDLWTIYTGIDITRKRVRLMGWTENLSRHCGPPPEWAETLAPAEQSTHEFLSSLHCFVPVNGGARENWPRVGLEAMATGVPIVTENQWGWPEMIRSGESGLLARDYRELISHVKRLAEDESMRLELAHNARRRLEMRLAPVERIVSQWRSLWQSLDEPRAVRQATPTPIKRTRRIPNTIHFFCACDHPNALPFKFVHYLAVKSAFVTQNPDRLFLHYSGQPCGEWWQRAAALGEAVRAELPTEIMGRPLVGPTHQVDVLRLQTLIERGGIALDLDVICLQPFTALLQYPVVMAQESHLGLCPAVLLAKRNATFLREWLKCYASFRSQGRDRFYGEHGVLVPMRLAHYMPDQIHVLSSRRFFWPTYDQRDLRDFFESTDDLNYTRDSFAVHLWQQLTWRRYLETLTPEMIRSGNSEFCRIARRFLD
jgi:hypothetical protein